MISDLDQAYADPLSESLVTLGPALGLVHEDGVSENDEGVNTTLYGGVKITQPRKG